MSLFRWFGACVWRHVLPGICVVCSAWLPLTGSAQQKSAFERLEPVTYLLPGPANQPAFAPWMIARQQGYFAQEGLEVDFVAAKGGVDVAKQLGAGNAPIGGASGDTSIIVRNNGVPVKAVAVLGAGTHMLVVSHQDAPVLEPVQLKDKRISVLGYADTSYYFLLGTLRRAGLSRDDAQIQNAGASGAWQLFAARRFDVMVGVPDWIVNAEATGARLTWMAPGKAAQSMAQAILASDATIANNPQLVQRMVRATLRGMQLIMTDMDAAVAAYIKAVPMHTGREAQLRRMFELYRQYAYADQAVPGQINVERLRALQDFYVQEGVIDKAAPIDDLYTNQFVLPGR